MKTPLKDAITGRLSHISFHTPAHSGVISPYDITELPYSGNLLERVGVTAESETEVSSVYGAEKTLFVTSGATTAIHAAIAVFAGGKFVVFGTAHKSVFSGMRLFAGEAHYINVFDALGSALKEIRPNALIVSSPDYFGNTLQLEKIRALCDTYSVALIIDAAHGSHFAFCNKLPQSATEHGDLVIHSLHKTLPVLTGGALLHCKKKHYPSAALALSELHTSSPSYPIMLSIEAAAALMSQEGESLWSRVIDGIARFAKGLPPKFSIEENDDPTRLVVSSPYDGNAVMCELNKVGIYPEMCCGGKVVFIVTSYNVDNLDKLAQAYDKLDGLPLCETSLSAPDIGKPAKLLLNNKSERIAIENAVGRILYREIGYYPPGVPIFLSGHLLNKDDVDFISANRNHLFGLDNGGVYVLS